MSRFIRGLVGFILGTAAGLIWGGQYITDHPSRADYQQVVSRSALGAATGVGLMLKQSRLAAGALLGFILAPRLMDAGEYIEATPEERLGESKVGATIGLILASFSLRWGPFRRKANRA